MDETARYVKSIRLAWEKLRIVYNAVLLLEGLTWVSAWWEVEKVTENPYYRVGGMWSLAILFGVVANALYCLGPLAEVCAYRFFGWRMDRGRYFLFGAGLLCSIAVVFFFGHLTFWRMLYYLRTGHATS
jgi:hypothetical protein